MLVRYSQLIGLAKLEGIVKARVVVEHETRGHKEIRKRREQQLYSQLQSQCPSGLFPAKVGKKQRDDEQICQCNRRTAAKGKASKERAKRRVYDLEVFRRFLVNSLEEKIKAPNHHTDARRDGGAVKCREAGSVPETDDREAGRQDQIGSQRHFREEPARQQPEKGKQANYPDPGKDLSGMHGV